MLNVPLYKMPPTKFQAPRVSLSVRPPESRPVRLTVVLLSREKLARAACENWPPRFRVALLVTVTVPVGPVQTLPLPPEVPMDRVLPLPSALRVPVLVKGV